MARFCRVPALPSLLLVRPVLAGMVGAVVRSDDALEDGVLDGRKETLGVGDVAVAAEVACFDGGAERLK